MKNDVLFGLSEQSCKRDQKVELGPAGQGNSWIYKTRRGSVHSHSQLVEVVL